MTAPTAADIALASLTGVGDLVVNTNTLSASFINAVTDATVTREITAAPTLTMNITDGPLTILNSGIFTKTTTAQVQSYKFGLVSVDKQSRQLTATFEDEVAIRLRAHNKPISIPAEKLTHVEFARQLVGTEPWIKLFIPSNAAAIKSYDALAVGDPTQIPTPQNPAETYWDALLRIAQARGWTRFVRGPNELWYVPEDWLYAQMPTLTLDPLSDACDDIDFQYDTGQAIGELTAYVRASLWTAPAGSVVQVVNCGPANGKWLVTTIYRSLFSEKATITLQKPTPTLPEPVPDSSTASTVDSLTQGNIVKPGVISRVSGIMVPLGTGGKDVNDFVNSALAEVGKPYVFGATPIPGSINPTSFDCSSLVQWAASRVGITLPRTADAQEGYCASHGSVISVARGEQTRGALLFRLHGGGADSHVVISLGDGRTVEAMGRAWGVVESKSAGRGWTQAGLVPGLRY